MNVKIDQSSIIVTSPVPHHLIPGIQLQLTFTVPETIVQMKADIIGGRIDEKLRDQVVSTLADLSPSADLIQALREVDIALKQAHA